MKRGRPRHDDILTPREWQVLALLAERRTNPEIALELGISADGAKYHVSQILAKLGVETREEAGRLYRTHRPEQRGLLPLLGFLRQLVAHPAAIPVASFALVAAAALTAWLVLGGSGSADNRSHSSITTEAIGLDIPPEEQMGAATVPAAAAFPHTLLLTKGTPTNTGSGAATIAAMQQVATLAELKSALTDSIKLVVVDRSALDEVRGSGILRELIASQRTVVGLNVASAELAVLADFNSIVRAGCSAGCPDYPRIRAPSMPERGFYSFLFYGEQISPTMIGQSQEYFFEGLFRDEMIGLDAGHYLNQAKDVMTVADIPAERIDVNRGMFCTYDDAKVAASAKHGVQAQLQEPVLGLSVIACQARQDGTVELRVLVMRPRPPVAPSAPCVSTPVASPPPGCTPVAALNGSDQLIVLVVPVSELLP